MTSAQKMREKAESGMRDRIMTLIGSEAEHGYLKVDLSDYEDLYLTEGISAFLEKEGYKINNTEISW